MRHCAPKCVRGPSGRGARRKPARIPRFSRNTNHETRITAFFQTRNTAFPWLVWYLLVLKPFSLVFSAGMCSGLRVMTPLLGTKTSSAPVGDASAGDNKATQVTVFQLFTRPEARDTALAWREAQAGANSEVFTKHETRDTNHGFFQTRNTAFPWLVWYLLVLKPFSLFFGRKPVYVESDDAVVGNENPVRARRGQVGWGHKSRPVAAFLRVVARHGAAMARHERPLSPAPATRLFFETRPYAFHESQLPYPRFPTISHDFPAFPGPPTPPPPIKCPRAVRLSWSAARTAAPPGHCFPARCGAVWGGYGAAWAAAVPRTGNTAFRVFTKHETRDTKHGFYAFHETRITAFFSHAAAVGW